MLFYGKEFEEESVFSSCREYRYKRLMEWSHGKRTCIFVMRNPAGTIEGKLSKTIKKCIEISKLNGCGSLITLNLCAYIAEDWQTLKEAKEECINIIEKEKGENEKHFRSALAIPNALVIAAWGSKGKYLQDEVDKFKKLAKEVGASVTYLGPELLKGNQPTHPANWGFSYSGLCQFSLD